MTTQPEYLKGVKDIIVVLSGKGGVGKSTVACQLAFALALDQKARVGILDVDICGPSVPKIVGVENKNVVQGPNGWIPVEASLEVASPAAEEILSEDKAKGEAKTGSLKVMSIAFLLPNQTDAVVWRGPRKDAMIKQFVTAVDWGQLDYLIVDTPPGTSDEHLTLCEALAALDPTGAVVVTTPQNVAVDDVKKELSFCGKLKMRCLGIVENMSGYVCPHCAECTQIFSKGGGEKLAKQYEIPFLGAIPLTPQISMSEDAGRSYVVEEGQGGPIKSVVANILEQAKLVAEKKKKARNAELAAAGFPTDATW